MADVKWIKIITGIFDDEKILLIESMPSADSIIVIWFKLLTLAGKQNNDGVFMMSNRIPYTDEMLASIFRRDVNTVRMSLKVFEQFGMIEIINNVITIPNWNKHQTLDAYEKKKERDRLYQAERRAAQRALIAKSSDASYDTSPDPSSDVAVSDKEEDKEGDYKKESITADEPPPPPAPAKSKIVRKKYGQYGWVHLSDEEYRRLVDDFGEAEVLRCITYVDESAQGNGNKNKWKDWNLVVRRCHREGWGLQRGNKHQVAAHPETQKQREGADWMVKYMTRPKPRTAGDDPAIMARAEQLQKKLKGE